jgi:hypothetical protein
MDGVKIQLPLGELACPECREATLAERDPARLPFHLTHVMVEGEAEMPPLMVDVDVQRISWHREQLGRYVASATVQMKCPCCDHMRESQCYLDAPLVLLTGMGKCRGCKGPLELEGEEIEYRDTGDGNWVVDVRANMFCVRCLVVEPRAAVVPVPGWEQFRPGGDLSVPLEEPTAERRRLIFICYRRDDSHDVTGRIFDRLSARFGAERVMRDVSSIPYGVNFKKFVEETMRDCSIALVVIGRQWTCVCTQDGKRRIEDPNDLVRQEIELALQRGIPLLPLFVGGAQMPARHELPESIEPLHFQNGLPIRGDPDFDEDIRRLIATVEQQVAYRQKGLQ